MADIQPLGPNDTVIPLAPGPVASPTGVTGPSIQPLGPDDTVIPLADVNGMSLTGRKGAVPGSTIERRDPALDELKYAAPTSEIARASLPPEVGDQIKRYASFFKQPLNEFSVQDGHIVRWVPEARAYARVEPSFGGSDNAPDNPTAIGDKMIRGADWIASGAGPIIPAVTGTAGMVGGAAAGLGLGSIPGAMAGAGSGAAAGEVGRQALDKALAGEDEKNFDWGNVGWQAVGNAAGVPIGAGLSKGVGMLARTPGVKDLVSKIPGLSDLASHPNYLGLSGSANNALANQIGDNLPDILARRQNAQDLGVDLSLGQMTHSGVLQQMERQVARYPETTDVVANLRRLQNEIQIPGAVRQTLDTMAPAGAPEAQIGKFRDAAENVVDQATERTRILADPAYKKAFEGGSMAPLEKQFEQHFADTSAQEAAASKKVAQAQQQMTNARGKQTLAGDVYGTSSANSKAAAAAKQLDEAQADLASVQQNKQAVLTRLQQAQADGTANAPGAVWNPRIQQFLDDPIMRGGINRGLEIQRLEAVADGKPFNPSEYAVIGMDDSGQPIVGSVPNMRLLDAGKRGLDAIIRDNQNQVTGQLTDYGKAVYKFNKAFVGQIDNANPAYQAARANFGSLADAKNMILDGGVGMINKLQGPDRQNMVGRIFSGQNLMPDEITKMRGQFVSAGKLDDWNAGVRAYVEGKLSDAMIPTQTGEMSNVAGKVYKGLWGNQQQANVMKAAIGDPQQLARWERLGSVLQDVAHQLPEGSPTASDLQAVGESPAKQVTKFMGKAFSGSTYLDIGNNLVEGITAMQNSNARTQLAKYLMTPEGDKALKTLRPMSPKSDVARKVLGAIFTGAGLTASGVRKPQDRP